MRRRARPSDLSRNSTWPGKIRCGIPHLVEVHAPELGPAPRALQVQARDAPERVAGLDGVDVGRVGLDLAERHAGLGGALGRGPLLGRDREVRLGRGRDSGRTGDRDAEREGGGGAGGDENRGRRVRRLMKAGLVARGRVLAGSRLLGRPFAPGRNPGLFPPRSPRPRRFGENPHSVSQILPIKP